MNQRKGEKMTWGEESPVTAHTERKFEIRIYPLASSLCGNQSPFLHVEPQELDIPLQMQYEADTRVTVPISTIASKAM